MDLLVIRIEERISLGVQRMNSRYKTNGTDILATYWAGGSELD